MSVQKDCTLFVRMSVVCTIIMTVALLGAGMMEEMTVRFAISGAAAFLVWGIDAIIVSK